MLGFNGSVFSATVLVGLFLEPGLLLLIFAFIFPAFLLKFKNLLEVLVYITAPSYFSSTRLSFSNIILSGSVSWNSIGRTLFLRAENSIFLSELIPPMGLCMKCPSRLVGICSLSFILLNLIIDLLVYYPCDSYVMRISLIPKRRFASVSFLFSWDCVTPCHRLFGCILSEFLIFQTV